MSEEMHRNTAADVVKLVLFGVLKLLLLIVWWTAMLFLVSIVLTGVWQVGWEELLLYGLLLTALTVFGYAIYKGVVHLRQTR